MFFVVLVSIGVWCCRNDIVDSDEHSRSFVSGRDSTLFDRQRLQYACSHHVPDLAIQYIESGSHVALVLSVTNVNESIDRIHSRILRERSGERFERVAKRLDRQLFAFANSLGMLSKVFGEHDFDRASPREHLPCFDSQFEYVEAVVENPLHLFVDVFRPPTKED